MTDGRALLAAVIENPDHDTPRLAYADWLDGHGDPARAEFIRVQCQLARLPEEDDRRASLTAYERRLFVPNWRRWSGGRFPSCADFVRGFLERDSFSAEWWDDESHRAWAKWMGSDPIRDLDVEPYSGESLLQLPGLDRLRVLRLTSRRGSSFSTSEIMAILRAPQLASLQALDLSDNHIGDRGFASLVTPPGEAPFAGLRGLRYLNAAGIDLGNAAVRALTDSAPAESLVHLGLAANERITPGGLKALLRSALWSRLREADLSGLVLDKAPDYEELVGRLAGSRVQRLSLALLAGRTGTGAALAKALASAASWGELRALDLSYLKLGRAGIKALAGCPHLSSLRRLHLTNAGLTGRDLEALAASPYLKNLLALNLHDNPLGDRGAAALAGSPHLSGLIYLDLGRTGVTDAGAAALARSANVQHLRVLDLFGSGECRDPRVGSVGMKALAASPMLGRLTTLGLTYTHLTDAGVTAIARSEHLRNLSLLKLHGGSKITKKGQQALLDATHIAWPDVIPDELKTPGLRERYAARFVNSVGQYEFPTDEPFFRWPDLPLTRNNS